MTKAKYNIERKCKICGASFLAKTLDSVYCSRRCSTAAYRQKKRAEAQRQKFDAIAKSIPPTKDFLSVKEATYLYSVSKETLYRLIRRNRISYINIGIRGIRLSRTDLEKNFAHREESIRRETEQPVKTYRLEIEDCYTIGEVTERFGVSASTVYSAIRKYSVPMRQIGRFVYVPKNDVNEIFGK